MVPLDQGIHEGTNKTYVIYAKTVRFGTAMTPLCPIGNGIGKNNVPAPCLGFLIQLELLLETYPRAGHAVEGDHKRTRRACTVVGGEINEIGAEPAVKGEESNGPFTIPWIGEATARRPSPKKQQQTPPLSIRSTHSTNGFLRLP